GASYASCLSVIPRHAPAIWITSFLRPRAPRARAISCHCAGAIIAPRQPAAGHTSWCIRGATTGTRRREVRISWTPTARMPCPTCPTQGRPPDSAAPASPTSPSASMRPSSRRFPATPAREHPRIERGPKWPPKPKPSPVAPPCLGENHRPRYRRNPHRSDLTPCCFWRPQYFHTSCCVHTSCCFQTPWPLQTQRNFKRNATFSGLQDHSNARDDCERKHQIAKHRPVQAVMHEFAREGAERQERQ